MRGDLAWLDVLDLNVVAGFASSTLSGTWRVFDDDKFAMLLVLYFLFILCMAMDLVRRTSSAFFTVMLLGPCGCSWFLEIFFSLRMHLRAGDALPHALSL